MHTPAGFRHASASLAAERSQAEAGAARVLVPVPTSSTDRASTVGLTTEQALANTVFAREGLMREIGAFALDSDGRRLSSLRCAVGFAARALAVPELGRRAERSWMITTTYAGDNSAWRSDHWKEAIHRVRSWCARQGIKARYVWVAELQKRGVIHYHAVFWLPVGVRMPKWDLRGWWPHGRCNRALVKKSAVGYLMKYLSKGTDVSSGTFPKGARIYGAGGLDHAMRRARRWLRLPAFVQGNSSIWGKWSRAVGGGWLSPCGQHVRSEFQPTEVGGLRALLRVARHPTIIAASGPFSWLTDKETALASSVKH